MIKNSVQIFKYIFSDFIASSIGWLCFNMFRYFMIADSITYSLKEFLLFPDVIIGQLCVGFFWLIIFFFSGYYNQPFQKSRFEELKQTFSSILIGSLFLFFLIIVNDFHYSTTYYIKLFISLVLVEFVFIYYCRFLITRFATREIHGGRWGFNTLIIGAGRHASELSKDLQQKKQKLGYTIIGYIQTDTDKVGSNELPILDSLDHIDKVVEEYQIERFILALDTRNSYTIFQIVQKLLPFGFPIRMQAGLQDILLGKVKMRALYETPMIDISRGKLGDGLNNCKRALDIVVSSLVLLFFSPLYFILALYVKLDSKGPIFYKQERIGKFGRPFQIIKFRTMYNDAELAGPQLTSLNDKRITPLGLFLRKYRLDELPQFWNVLKGEMSLVGPRPERAFYINQIAKKAPYYCLLQQIRPGITSWGMVKYGYASNVDQMIDRLQYDLLYLENLSIAVDCKILIYTIRTVLTGRGI